MFDIFKLKKYSQKVPTRTSPRATIAPDTNTTAPAVSPPVVPSRGIVPGAARSGAAAAIHAVSKSNVKEMQMAIQRLFATISSEIPFLDFLINQYKIKFDKNKLSRRILINGIWDKNTNSYLYDIYQTGNGIIKALEDFGGVAQNARNIFHKADLEQFESIANEKIKNDREGIKNDPKDLEENAKILTGIINKLKEFYQNYSQIVMSNEHYNKVTNKDYVLMKLNDSPSAPEDVSKATSDPNYLNANENGFGDFNILGANGANVLFPRDYPLRLSSISNANDFKIFLNTRLGYSKEQANDPKIQNQVIDEIIAKLTSTKQVAGLTSQKLTPTKQVAG